MTSWFFSRKRSRSARLLAEHLHQNVPANAEGLLEDVGQVGALLLRLSCQLLPDAPHPAGRHDEQRQNENGDQSEGPAKVEDHRQSRPQDYGVGHDAHHSAGHHVLYARHVAVEARDGVPGAHANKEAQVKALEVAVQLVSHIVHHALANQVAQVVLPHADEAGEQGGDHHAHRQDAQLRKVLVRDGAVYDGADEQGRHEAQHRRGRDAHQYVDRLGLVRPEVAQDSPHAANGDGRDRLRRVSVPPGSIMSFHHPYSLLRRGNRARLPAASISSPTP